MARLEIIKLERKKQFKLKVVTKKVNPSIIKNQECRKIS